MGGVSDQLDTCVCTKLEAVKVNDQSCDREALYDQIARNIQVIAAQIDNEILLPKSNEGKQAPSSFNLFWDTLSSTARFMMAIGIKVYVASA
ncbi:hypothetical protein EB796_021175 [Bugula neritina]|uniref:Uncharacterized protein n=1 Tax=Bugula neritina TaxID=10212 RepID=A0A7J7J510_BUGNE|nr:hypothetical protein EB796_021175 [Bugula neritina]